VSVGLKQTQLRVDMERMAPGMCELILGAVEDIDDLLIIGIVPIGQSTIAQLLPDLSGRVQLS
jgi:hypothetical protein